MQGDKINRISKQSTIKPAPKHPKLVGADRKFPAANEVENRNEQCWKRNLQSLVRDKCECEEIVHLFTQGKTCDGDLIARVQS